MLPLSEREKSALVALARNAVEAAVREGRLPEAIPAEDVFARPGRAFVTLRWRGRLRGCIGHIEPPEPLGECILRAAMGAALQDPRFRALRPEELVDLRVEVSVLSQPQLIEPDDIEIGRHGVLVCANGRRGLLLPQVAKEHGFTRERFLEETCLKAGLIATAWRDPVTQVYGFECEVIVERARSEETPAR